MDEWFGVRSRTFGSGDPFVAAYWDDRAPLFNAAASHTRHETAWQTVLRAAFDADSSPKDVVDLGTGTGACALIAASLGHRVRGFDGSPSMLGVARDAAHRAGLNVEFIHAFLDDVQIESQSADIVTIRNVLWTLEHPMEALSLAHRVLRPGGRIVVSDGLWSVSAKDWSTYSNELATRLPYHSGLTEEDGRALLREAGFREPRSWQHLFAEHPYPGDVPFFVLSALKL